MTPGQPPKHQNPAPFGFPPLRRCCTHGVLFSIACDLCEDDARDEARRRQQAQEQKPGNPEPNGEP